MAIHTKKMNTIDLKIVQLTSNFNKRIYPNNTMVENLFYLIFKVFIKVA